MKIGDTVLDQFSDTIIAQNYEVNGFGDLATRNGGFSNDFELPLTSLNELALGFPSDLNIDNRNPYEKIDAQLIDVGAVVAIGYLRYKVIEDKKIKCAFFGGNTEWFSLIKDKKMTELDLSDYNHNWDHTTIGAAISADKNTGYIYPIIDYGYFIGAALGTNTLIPSDQFFPGMFVHTLVEQIFEDIGWTVSGELHNYTVDTPYRRMIQPFSAADFVKPQSYIDDNTIDYDELGTPLIDRTSPGGGTVLWTGSPVDGIINVTKNDNYNFRVSISVTLTGGGTDLIVVELFKNMVSVASAAKLQPGVNEIILTVENYALLTSDDLTIIVYADTGVTPGDIDITSGDITITPINQMVVGNLITMSATMPDMLQSEFLRYIFFSLGVVAQADNYSKTVDLALFRTIEDNLPSALDWSDKIDTSKKITTDFTQLMNNYSRVSVINYEEDDDDPELKAYKAETSENFGRGQFDINSEHLDPIKEIYTAPYVPMINILSFTDEMYIPQIKWFVEDPDNPGTFTKEFEPKAKVGIMSENISVSDLTFAQATTFRIHVPGDTATYTQVSNVPFTWFAKTSYIAVIDALFDSLVYDQIKFSTVIGDPLISTYLQDYEDILNEMKYVKAFFKLNEVDINGLDFMIPVYIDRFKSYFYINKIKNYQGATKTTEVELVRIGNV